MRSFLVTTFVLATICILTSAACSDPFEDEFSCDKSAQTVNPHCTDTTLTGDTDDMKNTCRRESGKLVDKCAHGLGGCKAESEHMTKTLWFFPDETTKTADDVKKKCTGMTFVEP